MSKREELEKLIKSCAYLCIVMGEIDLNSSPLAPGANELVEDMLITAKSKYEKRYGAEAFNTFAKNTGFSLEC